MAIYLSHPSNIFDPRPYFSSSGDINISLFRDQKKCTHLAQLSTKAPPTSNNTSNNTMDQSSQVAPSGRADSPSTLSDAQQPAPYQPMGEHRVLFRRIAVNV
ncbi:uncharacterized protein CCOS01_02356 [Colletotrichum costaricense]|uniref:Uncharacterized protein n=2 Tax=Colletotrichum acutatum species complex TaxID=2707335 RepID=A0AAI9Z7V3_9PEZI|nr:uncharacterized protein CCOS01_02356 [Colletotrichum costaricense]XP_060387530.1 uncharacterized protein CTAM01_01956 [Colletotrichum tamarilloi]KAK1509833.1 hypothetical protein CTAM01_01956 [Colletotrichum tamarilloi]KAK1537036.1 hypothetical protein CCOS01_02356 [Colletotrichum costaricense]